MDSGIAIPPYSPDSIAENGNWSGRGSKLAGASLRRRWHISNGILHSSRQGHKWLGGREPFSLDGITWRPPTARAVLQWPSEPDDIQIVSYLVPPFVGGQLLINRENPHSHDRGVKRSGQQLHSMCWRSLRCQT